jgi:prepilin-type N-terminal cleavage/methylation domain-containing protein
MDKKGFTLIELIIVVAIIGILAMIAVPAYIGQQKNATRTEAYSNLQNLRLLEEQYLAENGCYYMTGATPACTNATRTGLAGIQQNASGNPFLPGFNPGSSLSFSYSITTNSTGTGGGTASCFVATATGNANTRVYGDTFTIDCNNNRNF